MDIVIHSEDNVDVDGHPAGSIADVLRNYGERDRQRRTTMGAESGDEGVGPDVEGLVMDTLKRWRKDHDTSRSDTVRQALDRQRKELTEALERFEKDAAARQEAFNRQVAEIRSKAAGLIAAKDAAIVQLQAELAALKAASRSEK